MSVSLLDASEGFLVEIVFGLAGPRGGAERRHVFPEAGQFLLKIIGDLRPEAVLQAVIEEDGMGQLGDLLLICCLRLFFDFIGFLTLLDDFLGHRPDLVERVVAQARFLDALVLEFQFADEIGVMNDKDGAVIRLFGTRRNFEQPLRCLQFFGVMPEFPRRHLLQRDVPGAADLQE